VVAERISKALGMEVIATMTLKSRDGKYGISSSQMMPERSGLLDLLINRLSVQRWKNQVHTASDLMFEEVPPDAAKRPREH